MTVNPPSKGNAKEPEMPSSKGFKWRYWYRKTRQILPLLQIIALITSLSLAICRTIS